MYPGLSLQCAGTKTDRNRACRRQSGAPTSAGCSHRNHGRGLSTARDRDSNCSRNGLTYRLTDRGYCRGRINFWRAPPLLAVPIAVAGTAPIRCQEVLRLQLTNPEYSGDDHDHLPFEAEGQLLPVSPWLKSQLAEMVSQSNGSTLEPLTALTFRFNDPNLFSHPRRLSPSGNPAGTRPQRLAVRYHHRL